MTTPYSEPISAESLSKKDQEIEAANRELFQDDIAHFERALELIIAIFENAKRANAEGEEESEYLKLLAVRVVQDSRSAMNLALKGMYPQSASLTRGILLTIMLIEDFRQHPEHERIWVEGGKKKRNKLFKDDALRSRLKADKAKGADQSVALYDLISHIAVHTNIESFMWYLDRREEKLLVHWAGQADELRAQQSIRPIVTATGIALMALFDGNFFIFENEEILQEYGKWREANRSRMRQTVEALTKQDPSVHL